MRFEEKLGLSIASEEIANTKTPDEARPNHRAIFDAISKFLEMDIDDLYAFATSGGYIDEGRMVITGLPDSIIAEQVVTRTVHTGNYYRVLEIVIDKVDPAYVVYTIVKLGVPDSTINASIQTNMARWEKGDPLPFAAHSTEELALKALGEKEDKAAEAAPLAVKPSTKQPKKKASPPVDVRRAAVQMATKLGKPETIPIIKKMSARDIREAAKKGKEITTISTWTIAKIVFLGFLGIQAIYQGAAGIAALVIGVFAVLWIDHARQK